MRNTVLILLISALQVFATGSYAQTKKISLAMNDAAIRDVLYAIQKQSEFYFLYNSELIDVTKKVDITINEEKVDQVLTRLFNKNEVDFLIKDRYIVLTPVGGNAELFAEQQQPAVSGTVTDQSGQPLPGVTVVVKGTTQGTVTNADGEYSISSLPEDATLVFSFVGMRTQEVVVGSQTSINVRMEEDVIGIEEVVAIGYGTMRKSDLTGSVAGVKTEDLEAIPAYNMEQALKSRVPGVQVTQNSGTPGSRIEVRIRGGNSMIGDNNPLYVVDGFPVTGGIDFLNSSDIESVDILKDASATAIYGARGANGVVIITSKRGKAGQKGTIEVDSYYGVQQEIKRYEVLDAKQYAEVANQWLTNGGEEPYFNVNEVQNHGTDWQNIIFQSAPIQNHTISTSGFSKVTRYSLSGNYYEQTGLIINSGIKRGSFRLNLDHDIKEWATLTVNLNLSRRERLSNNVDNTYYGTGILSGALSTPPTLPVYDENGQYMQIEAIYPFGSIDMRNPLIHSSPRKSKSFGNSVLGNATLEIKLHKDLFFKTLLGLDYGTTLGEGFTPIIFANDRGGASESFSYRNAFLNENTLNYSKTINDIHVLNAVAGFTFQTNMNRSHSIGVSGLSNNITQNFDLSAAETIGIPSSGMSEWTITSWLGRVNYSLRNKYLFTASIRSDGSSRFGANHKWGHFPSGAIAWRMSEESFMKKLSMISDLKLRASYGITGNTALSPYQSLDRMSTVNNIFGNHSQVIGFVPSGIANSDLKWETTAQLDIGLDLNMFDNRMRLVFDYYKKNTTNLLASVPLPPSVGFGSILKNIGEIQNQGFEFSTQVDILSGGFKWDAMIQASTNKNKVIKLAGDSEIYGGSIGLPFNTSLNIARIGEPFGVFWGYLEDGLDENGYIKYIDTNKDGVKNTDDKVIIGNPYPDFLYGFNSNFSYKNFDLNAFFEGVFGNDIIWATSGTHLNSFQRGQNQFAEIWGNYWTKENPDPNAKFPIISRSVQPDFSDRFVKDGSYLRLKTLRLAYNIPIEKMGISLFENAQIYFSGTNLFTITNYPGLDPEVNTRGTDSSSVGSRLRIGIDESAYPTAKVYAVGLKIKF